jgi:hypothetical protein
MKHARLLIPALLFTAATVYVSCSKSNKGGKPTIKLKSINTDIKLGQDLDARFEVSDAGPTLDSFVFIRVRLNEIPLPVGSEGIDSFVESVPSYPSRDKVELQYVFQYASLHQAPQGQVDTFVFKAAVIDHAGKSSDTITTPKVTVQSQ